jgi:hypothetical protein
MKEKPANSELLRISEAVARLEAGMYGSFNRPEQIVKIKTFEPRLSVGSGDRKQHAAALIDVAISTGDLPVYVLADSPGAQAAQTLLQVPLGILSQMIRIRGGLPDHAIRAERFRDKAPVSKELLGALTHSALYVPRDAFDSWYKSARSKRNWPSQRSSKKSRTGRPSKQSDGLRHSIIAFVNEGKWSAQQNSLASLMRLLEAKGEAPSRQTIQRMLDQLYRENGDDRYRTGRRAKTDHSRSPRPGSDSPNEL